MAHFQGLAYCAGSMSSPLCIEKAVETGISSVLIVVSACILGHRLYKERQVGLSALTMMAMILSLIFNITYSLYHDIYVLYYTESLFYDLYYPTLVYLFVVKLFKKHGLYLGRTLVATNVIFGLYFTLMFGIYIWRLSTLYIDCKEIFYVIIDSCGIVLSVWLLIFSRQHQAAEKQKTEGMLIEAGSVNNPIPRIWRCVIINTIGQFCGLIETLIFLCLPSNNCKFSEDQATDVGLKFMFVCLYYYMGMVATLIFFAEGIMRPTSNRDGARVELVGVQSSSIEQI